MYRILQQKLPQCIEGKAACQAASSAVRRRAVWRRGGHFPRKGCRHPKFSSLPNHAPWWARSAGRLRRPFFEMSATHLSGSQKHSCGCAFYVPFSASENRRLCCIEIAISRDHSRDHCSLASRAREILEARSRTGKSRLRRSEVEVKGPRLPRGKGTCF